MVERLFLFSLMLGVRLVFVQPCLLLLFARNSNRGRVGHGKDYKQYGGVMYTITLHFKHSIQRTVKGFSSFGSCLKFLSSTTNRRHPVYGVAIRVEITIKE